MTKQQQQITLSLWGLWQQHLVSVLGSASSGKLLFPTEVPGLTLILYT